MSPAPLQLAVTDLMPAEQNERLVEALARFTITPILAPGPEFEAGGLCFCPPPAGE